jgi:endogenous inhibitor of DNA gyrase (YacG/DUF329 family)
MNEKRKCERCGREFDFRKKSSKRAAGRFCSKMCFYDSRREYRTCPRCGKEFVAARSRIMARKDVFCSKTCYIEDIRRNQINLECIHCGKSFPVGQDRMSSKYCCAKCRRDHNGSSRICSVCGKQFRVSNSVVAKGYGKYCSQACHYKDHLITKICPICGGEFTKTKSKKTQFCSVACQHKGVIPWNKDKKGYVLVTRRNSQIKKGLAMLCACKWCGEEFYNPAWRIRANMFCCSLAHARLYARHRGTVISKCRGCGNDFEVKLRDQSNENGRRCRSYCSDECRGKYYDSVGGLCVNCGEPMKICRSKLSQRSHFCSRKCHVAYAVNENAPGWKGGVTFATNTGHKIVITDKRRNKIYKGASSPSRIYRLEHRVIIEKYIGRPLTINNEPVWHLNGIPTDNRIENLYVCSDRRELTSFVMGNSEPPNRSNVEDLRRAILADPTRRNHDGDL